MAARRPAARNAPADRPPETYRAFVARFPALADAWERLGIAGRCGPLDERIARLLKLAVAAGALREGAVRSGARKARAAGVSEAELDQVVALAAGTIGLPAAVAVWSWIRPGPARRALPGRRRGTPAR